MTSTCNGIAVDNRQTISGVILRSSNMVEYGQVELMSASDSAAGS